MMMDPTQRRRLLNMKKHGLRLAWYASTPLFFFLGLAILPQSISRGFLDILTGYIPFSLFLAVYVNLAGNEYRGIFLQHWPAKKILFATAMIAAGWFVTALVFDSRHMLAISTIFILSTAEGFLLERERKIKNN